MRRRISHRALWRYLLRGLILCGACAGGSARCYLEWARENPADGQSVECWDWSVPHRWYEAAHRH
ncbi:hypothetical protein DFR70_109200 [Nocardia tenerifensis]|uniref:Uncharacterized protein n=1 Tax=Nocardia tenerifensis TaxID=228006 RepID=A0A318JWM8_9NOCA|nr:hypothetical protein [Nocardia tenerifensis]PXX61009.1 hypothetical protein DFR70_109200 [Nocardia tenerifensis]